VATVVGLFVSPGRGTGLSEARDRVTAIAGQGLKGCAHANPPRREVLLASKAHLDSVGVEPGAIRENVTVDGDDVQTWDVGRRVQVGQALLEITMVCDPCSRMDDLRPGLRTEIDGKRGMLAAVIEGGEIALGDSVTLV
jgi:MOSC domain-containing protein YiiM